MRPDRWERIEELIDAVLDLPDTERRAFLEQACPDDPALRTEVLEILAAGEEPAPLLDQPLTEVASAMREFTGETPVPLPERVGPYRIERVIGEGGMGTVFLAHRDDGQFDQRVALKLVRRGPHLDARVVRRFREERQILAALNHPGIARLLDGGIAEDGLPYFAMEHVEGESITKYCIRHGLDVESRLSLFVRVCDALAHAHERQIVHRDVKPSNILVTAEGEPRLLDFGIAKLLAPDGDASSLTRRSERFLTPEYASPEQIKGEPVGVARDQDDGHRRRALAQPLAEFEAAHPGQAHVDDGAVHLDAAGLEVLGGRKRDDPVAHRPEQSVQGGADVVVVIHDGKGHRVWTDHQRQPY